MCMAGSGRSQNYNIVPDIIPDIIPDIEVLFDILIENLRCRIIFLNIEENIFDIRRFRPDIQTYPSLLLNTGPYIEYFLQYKNKFIQYRD
jgi:hypothetical protein